MRLPGSTSPQPPMPVSEPERGRAVAARSLRPAAPAGLPWGLALAGVCSLSMLLSALLLFTVEPMFAKMALPLLGGSASVWNTATVFYQLALLAGYLYAHYATGRLPAGRHALVHLLLLLAALFVLPIAIPAGAQPPVDSSPIPWLLSLMLVRVGLPFVLLSATSPVLQKWFASTRHPAASDPYFLYAASNIGSLAGLLAYPLIIEPNVTVQAQSRLWVGGYVIFIVLALASAVAVLRSPRAAAAGAVAPAPRLEAPGTVRRARWVLLAFLPSSLMLSVTTYLSTDLAPFPLLWVIPLALYLLTFVLAFSGRTIISRTLPPRALPMLIMVVAMGMVFGFGLPIWLALPLHLVTFFFVAMQCHQALADDRPSPQHLTEFYLWLSVGGALGGMFNALVAPMVFKSVAEYGIGLVLAALLIRPGGKPARLYRGWPDLALPALLAALIGAEFLITRSLPDAPFSLRFALLAVPALLCFSFSRRPLRFSLGLAAMLLAGTALFASRGTLLYADRSFFGVNRVLLDAQHGRQMLYHGTTMHGMQMTDPVHHCDPTAYYYPTGPIGQAFATFKGSLERKQIAVVGLGAGGLAGYARPGQAWTFYEIDPSVARIANEPRYFTYLTECAPQARVVLGDGRLSLSREPAGKFDLIILDAYTSDSIPVHLLTREALELYRDRLSAGGLIAMNISNNYLELRPVVANLAGATSLAAMAWRDTVISPEEGAQGKYASEWVVMARSAADFGPLAADGRWQPLAARPGARVWTDDYSSILSAVRWR